MCVVCVVYAWGVCVEGFCGVVCVVCFGCYVYVLCEWVACVCVLCVWSLCVCGAYVCVVGVLCVRVMCV